MKAEPKIYKMVMVIRADLRRIEDSANNDDVIDVLNVFESVGNACHGAKELIIRDEYELIISNLRANIPEELHEEFDADVRLVNIMRQKDLAEMN